MILHRIHCYELPGFILSIFMYLGSFSFWIISLSSHRIKISTNLSSFSITSSFFLPAKNTVDNAILNSTNFHCGPSINSISSIWELRALIFLLHLQAFFPSYKFWHWGLAICILINLLGNYDACLRIILEKKCLNVIQFHWPSTWYSKRHPN